MTWTTGWKLAMDGGRVNWDETFHLAGEKSSSAGISNGTTTKTSEWLSWSAVDGTINCSTASLSLCHVTILFTRLEIAAAAAHGYRELYKIPMLSIVCSRGLESDNSFVCCFPKKKNQVKLSSLLLIHSKCERWMLFQRENLAQILCFDQNSFRWWNSVVHHYVMRGWHSSMMNQPMFEVSVCFLLGVVHCSSL